jgi:hypothetical protein
MKMLLLFALKLSSDKVPLTKTKEPETIETTVTNIFLEANRSAIFLTEKKLKNENTLILLPI